MSEVTSATIPESPRVAGYVEAITADAALGWVWQPGRATRLSVQLRRGATVVAHAVADGLRQDLAQGGIGDGRHAFTLPIPEALREHAATLQVVTVLENGDEIALEPPPAAPPEATRLAQLQKSVDMLVASQRLIHRNLQAALLQRPASATLDEIAAAQTELRQAIETVELFAVRLEQSAAPAPEAPSRAPNRVLAGVAALSTAALIVSVWALAHSLVVG